MKKITMIMLVLGLACSANAAMNMVVDDQYLYMSETAHISIWGDGLTPVGAFYMGIGANEPGSLFINQALILYPGIPSFIQWEEEAEIAEILGLNNPCIYIQLYDVPPPSIPQKPLNGKLVDNIIFHMDGMGIATVNLFDGDGNLIDSKAIHEIPEPGTIALLAFGAFMLRRKNK